MGGVANVQVIVVVMLLNAENGLVNIWDDAHHPHHADTQSRRRRRSGRRSAARRRLPGWFADRQQQQHSSRSVTTAIENDDAEPRLVSIKYCCSDLPPFVVQSSRFYFPCPPTSQPTCNNPSLIIVLFIKVTCHWRISQRN